MSDGDLPKRLEQLGRTLVEDVETWERTTRERRRKALEQLTETVGRSIEEAFDRHKARQARREQRRKRKEERRQRQLEEASSLVGGGFALGAVACVVYASQHPELWWLYFIAFAMALSGARQLSLASERRRQKKAAQLAAGAPGGTSRHQIDVLCDELLADLHASPEAVRSFIQEPKKTVESLRKTAHALDARRRQLLEEADESNLRTLEDQRAKLELKRDAAVDPQARAKLEEAVRSLQGQKEALHQLRAAAERVDGEYTSLWVLLQELRTRVAVAKTASTSPQLEGLKKSVQRLNGELEAITEALHAVEQPGHAAAASFEETESLPPRSPERV